MSNTLKKLQLKKPKLKGNWSAKKLDRSHFNTLLEGPESVEVLGPEGEQIAVVIRKAIDMDIIRKSWPIISKINIKTENRGAASGTKVIRAVKKDGTISKTTRVPKGYEALSGVIGYYPRYPRIPYCRECAWNQHKQEDFARLNPLFKSVSELHQEYSPESFKLQQDIVKKTNQDFIIPNTIYTTVTVNKNFRTAAHLDAKNLLEGMAPMLLLRQGKYTGGHVVLPEWKTAVHLDTNDLIIFRNMIDYHGNTKITPLTENHQRCTMVFYYREEMIKCGTAEQELERAKSGENYSIDFSKEK